jgi:hypothetical protein
MRTSFKDGALKFMKDLEKQNGDDLIYSLALEGGNVFVMVTAHPSMTKKRWDTGNERIMFLVEETEYILDQDLLVEDFTERLTEHMVYVTDEDIDIFGNRIGVSDET